MSATMFDKIETIVDDILEEGAKRDAEKLSFDKINLEPHTLLGTVQITRTMSNMSAFSLERFAYDAMKFAIRKKLEESILYGDGVIKGIFNTSGVLSLQNYLTTATTLENTLKFASILDEAKGDTQKAVFVFKGSDEAKLRATPRTATSEKMLIENIGNIQGHRYYTTQLLKAGDCVYADFSKLFIATFAGLELLTHQERGGNIVLELFLDVDAKIGREKSFVTSKTSS